MLEYLYDEGCSPVKVDTSSDLRTDLPVDCPVQKVMFCERAVCGLYMALSLQVLQALLQSLATRDFSETLPNGHVLTCQYNSNMPFFGEILCHSLATLPPGLKHRYLPSDLVTLNDWKVSRH